ncbi:MAG: hypothetical protein AAB250_07165, partial [Bdellovibrionota bacterium]
NQPWLAALLVVLATLFAHLLLARTLLGRWLHAVGHNPRTSLISLENAPTFVNFRWNDFKSASFYTIQIASDADFMNVVAEKKVFKTAYVFEKPLPEGKVYWRVRAHTMKGFSDWSDPADLNVIYQ